MAGANNTMESKTERKRGGAREGAGRKPKYPKTTAPLSKVFARRCTADEYPELTKAFDRIRRATLKAEKAESKIHQREAKSMNNDTTVINTSSESQITLSNIKQEDYGILIKALKEVLEADKN